MARIVVGCALCLLGIGMWSIGSAIGGVPVLWIGSAVISSTFIKKIYLSPHKISVDSNEEAIRLPGLRAFVQSLCFVLTASFLILCVLFTIAPEPRKMRTTPDHTSGKNVYIDE